MFRVFRSEQYNKEFNKLDKFEQDRVSKFEQKLKEEPFSGKPLGYEFFREKKKGTTTRNRFNKSTIRYIQRDNR